MLQIEQIDNNKVLLLSAKRQWHEIEDIFQVRAENFILN